MSAWDVLNEPAIKAMLAQPYGRFSDAEFARRRVALTTVLQANTCDAILVCGEQRSGSGPCWLTGWPTTTEATVLFMPGEPDMMWVEHYNHVPNARTIAVGVDVRWAERKGAKLPAEEMRKRGLKRVGIMGPFSWTKAAALAESFELVDLSRAK